jgi:hypothetical protein
MPSSPPPGWVSLQEQARRTKDPQELARIIDAMNKLLTEYEEATGDVPKKKRGKAGAKLDKRNGQ